MAFKFNPFTVTLDITGGATLMNVGTTIPTFTADGQTELDYIGSTGRFYWRVDGKTYYVNGNLYTPPSYGTPVPQQLIGIFGAYTYPV